MSDQSREQKTVALMMKHHRFICRRARRAMPFRHLAEDVAQQVFVEFLSKANQWNLDEDLRPLLAVMVRNCALRVWRERAKEYPETLQEIGELVQRKMNETKTDTDDERLAALRGCLQKLAENGRRLITRYYFDEVSLKQLAKELQKKDDTVTKSIWRLREKLRTCIEWTIKTEECRD